jgi:hypothetical protein
LSSNACSRFVADAFEMRSFEEKKNPREKNGRGSRRSRRDAIAGCWKKTEKILSHRPSNKEERLTNRKNKTEKRGDRR